MVARFRILLNRRFHARGLGFDFRRAAGFIPPPEIQVGTAPVRLNLPDDGGTRTAFIDVLLDDCYFLRELPNDVETVIDIGSHVGLFSIAARNRWPHAIIHAYEPNGALSGKLKGHADQARFIVYEEAVGEVPRRVALIPNEDSVQVRVAEDTNGSIKQIAFREAVARLGDRVDLVKLDCEGGEWDILRDGESWQRVRFLTMEFHLWAGYTIGELKSRVSSLGFDIRRLQSRGPEFGILVACR